MSIFDLLFLALLLTAALTLFIALWFTFRGQFARALQILLGLGVGAVIYMSSVVVVSLVLPRRVLAPGATECFDDWCIGVAGFDKLARRQNVEYDLDLRLSSRARRVSQRENNLFVYLTDESGKRYAPVADASTVPFNILLGPGESVVARRAFFLPKNARNIGLILTHEGGFPIGWFIIGYDTWFRKPALLLLSR